MTPLELREYLDVLRASGVRKAIVGAAGGTLEVEFEPSPVPANGLMTADGKAIDLDEGNPWKDAEDYDAHAVQRANFTKPKVT